MATERKRITVTPGSELAQLLEEAAEAPVLLEKDGEVFCLHPAGNGAEDHWTPMNPEEARAIIDRYAGSWSDVDADELIAYIRQGREEGSRP